MSENYCVFWYPTIFHQEKVPRDYEESRFFIEISDNDIDEKKFYLKVEEVPADDAPGCNHLSFTLADRKDAENNDDAKTIKCEFHYRSHTRNGFVIYTYDREKLKHDYWNVFLSSDNERARSIDQLKVRVRERIIKKYKSEIPSGEEISPSDDLIKDYVIDRILISFYHYAKGFYHEHEVQSQSDGKLKAYYYSKEYWDGHRDYLTTAPTLSNKNNKVINWYLDQFEQQFISYAERISKDHRDFSKRINLRRRSRNALLSVLPDADEQIRKCLIEYWNIQNNESSERKGNQPPPISSLLRTAEDAVNTMSLEERRKKLESYTDSKSQSEINEIRDLHAKLRALSKLCGDALTEYTYCKALLGSKYNDDYRHDRQFNSNQVQLLSLYSDFFPELSKLDERRKRAFNIRNSIRYIEGVKQNCSKWESELTENLIEHVHKISKNHEETLDKIGELVKDVKHLSESHKENLAKTKELVNDVKHLSKKHEEALGKIEKLVEKVKILSEENKKMLKASEKSNLYSSLLGWISVSLGVISIGFALLTVEEICNWVGYSIVGIGGISIVVGCIKYSLRETNCPKKTQEE